MAATLEYRQSDLTPARIWLQATVALVAALGTGVLIHLLWVHTGLPDSAPAKYWPGSGLPGGLSYLAPAAVAACAIWPTALLALMLQFWPPNAALRPRAALTLDAASYLLLPPIALTPVLWQPMGNGFLAFSLFFMILLTIKAAMVFKVLALGYLAPNPDNISFKRNAFVFITALVFLGLAAGWTTLTNIPDPRETALLSRAASLMPGKTESRAAEEPDHASPWGAQPGVEGEPTVYANNGYYEELTAPLLSLTGRHGVIIFQAGLAAIIAVLLSAMLIRAGMPYATAAAAAGLALVGLPFLKLTIEAGPEILAALFASCGLILIQYRTERPFAAAFSLLGSGLFMAACGLCFSLPATALLAMGAHRSFKGKGPGGKAAAFLLAAGALSAMAPLVWHWFTNEPGAAAAGPAGIWPGIIEAIWKTPLASPIVILALAGILGSMKRHPRLMATGLIMIAASLIHPLISGPGAYCHGFRAFSALLLPMCALGLGLSLRALSRPWLRVIAMGASVWTLAVSWLAIMSPYILWESPANAEPKFLFRDLAAALTRLTGGGGLPDWSAWIVLAAMTGLVLWLAKLVRGSSQKPAQTPPRPWDARESMALILGLTATMAVSVLVFLIP